jgi:putative SOS response-associated peptidase YedK
MGFQYQAPADRQIYGFHFRVPAPKDMGSEIVVPGGDAVFVRRHLDSEIVDGQLPKRQALLGRFGISTPWPTREDEETKYWGIARTDNLVSNKLFGKLWESGQHCIVPIESFNKTDRHGKWPVKMRFSAAGKDAILGAAGFYSEVKLRNGKTLYRFVMLTIDADGYTVMRQFKTDKGENRMPLLLPKSKYDAWLDVPTERSIDFIEKCPTVDLRMVSISELRAAAALIAREQE